MKAVLLAQLAQRGRWGLQGPLERRERLVQRAHRARKDQKGRLVRPARLAHRVQKGHRGLSALCHRDLSRLLGTCRRAAIRSAMPTPSSLSIRTICLCGMATVGRTWGSSRALQEQLARRVRLGLLEPLVPRGQLEQLEQQAQRGPLEPPALPVRLEQLALPVLQAPVLPRRS
jgi:hypothetical protein